MEQASEREKEKEERGYPGGGGSASLLYSAASRAIRVRARSNSGDYANAIALKCILSKISDFIPREAMSKDATPFRALLFHAAFLPFGLLYRPRPRPRRCRRHRFRRRRC